MAHDTHTVYFVFYMIFITGIFSCSQRDIVWPRDLRVKEFQLSPKIQESIRSKAPPASERDK